MPTMHEGKPCYMVLALSLQGGNSYEFSPMMHDDYKLIIIRRNLLTANMTEYRGRTWAAVWLMDGLTEDLLKEQFYETYVTIDRGMHPLRAKYAEIPALDPKTAKPINVS